MRSMRRAPGFTAIAVLTLVSFGDAIHACRKLTNGWRSADIHPAILSTFGLTASAYARTQLRYDLRKMKAHGLLERIGRAHCYRLTDKGVKAALMFILFHKRVCGPLANSLFHHRPAEALKPASKLETAYHKADRAIKQVLELLAWPREILRDEFSNWPMLEPRIPAVYRTFDTPGVKNTG
jgi:hypothetical protein